MLCNLHVTETIEHGALNMLYSDYAVAYSNDYTVNTIQWDYAAIMSAAPDCNIKYQITHPTTMNMHSQ